MPKLIDVGLACDATADELRVILASGADVNEATADGYTALHMAAKADWNEDEDGRMQLLLEAGANTEAVASTQYVPGWTPLMLAAWEGYAAQLRKLIAFGSNVEATDECGQTALMLAVLQTHQPVEKVKALLDAGADPHKRSLEGKTALDYAVEHLGIVQRSESGIEPLQAEYRAKSRAYWAEALKKPLDDPEVEDHVQKHFRFDLIGSHKKGVEDCWKVIELLREAQSPGV